MLQSTSEPVLQRPTLPQSIRLAKYHRQTCTVRVIATTERCKQGILFIRRCLR